MMERTKKYLEDILISIEKIEVFVSDCADYNDYVNDDKTKSAVERHLAIIGEAINMFSKYEPNIEIEHARKIVSLRNRLIHAYASVDDTIVWAIIKNHLSPLKQEVEQIINLK